MKGKKAKKMLSIDCEEISGMEASVYSEIGADGLRFLKHDIMVSKKGITTISGVDYANLMPVAKDTIQAEGIQLGRGAACSVQSGIYKPLGLRVAVKTINVYDREKRHQIMKDIKILLTNLATAEKNGYTCNFLVNLYGAYFDEGSVKVILQMMDAGSLDGILKYYRSKNIKPRISEAVLAKIAVQILCGLSYLHTNKQLHRDIKPANILINTKGEVKISDFGISKELDFNEQMSKTFVGTYNYMSPERIQGSEYNAKSDVWSFGLVMYELATGDFPYAMNKTYIEMVNHINSEPTPELDVQQTGYSIHFRDFLAKALQKNCSKRSSSIQLLGHRWILENIVKPEQIGEWLIYVKQSILGQPV